MQGDPAVAATSTGYLVAWPEYGVPGVESAVFIEALGTSGRRTSSTKILPDVAVGSLSLACGPSTCLLAGFTNQGLLSVLLRHDGTMIGAPRVTATMRTNERPAVKAFDDGSFRVYHGNFVVAVSLTGEPGVAKAWHAAPVVVGDAVTWRGRTTLVYERSGQV